MSTQQKPKLTYFNGRGAAEFLRLIFAAAGVDFEDYRFPTNHDNAENPSRANDAFMEYKKSGGSITGQVPHLEIDGLHLDQSKAIARYLAKKYQLNGKDATEEVFIDMVGETLADLQIKYSTFNYEKDAERKAAGLKAFWDESLPKWGAMLERFLDLNKTGSGFFVGDKLSWADLFAFDLWSKASEANAEATKPFAKLAAHTEKIGSIPAIKKWVETRPVTPF
jgi:glutathione S-transferase